jgi:polysaccharide pyruvyl transferase WcaK-like protein
MNVGFGGHGNGRPDRFDQQAVQSRPCRIGFFGKFGSGNLGNDGSLEAVWEHMRRACPDAQFVCICTDPEIIRERFAIEVLPINWSSCSRGRFAWLNERFRKVPGKLVDVFNTVKGVRGLDMIMVPGTGILDDFGERPRGMPYDLLRWCLAARLAGVQIAFVSIGAGPIRNRLSKWLMRAAAGLASYRSYRDAVSKEFVEQVGLDVGQDGVYPDVAFGLPAPSVPARPRIGSSLTVGLGVMSYRGWYGFAPDSEVVHSRYLCNITEFAVWLLDQGHDVRLLVGEDSDHRTCELVVRDVHLARPGLVAGRIGFNPADSLHAVMRQIAGTDVVVATRYHNVVCALRLCRPTVALGYARKHDDLLHAMGLGDYGLSVDDFDLDVLKARFARLVSERGKLERMLHQRNLLVQEHLERQYANLVGRLP